MDTKLIFAFLIPFALTAIYFTYFEKVSPEYLREIPQEFIQDIKEVLLLVPVTPEKPDEFLEFLSTLEPVDSQNSEDTDFIPTEVDRVVYKVEFIGNWSQDTHSGYYPVNAHFSPPVAWSHNKSLQVYSVGSLASGGLEKMAELGGTITLEEELSELVDNGLLEYSVGKKFDAPGSSVQVIAVEKEYPYVSVVSMIAPSPDWFVASGVIELFVDGSWIETVSAPAFSYDAGTEQGNRFSIKNQATIPHNSIEVLTDIPAQDLPLFGEFIFTKIQN